jgi:hypothetical protein
LWFSNAVLRVSKPVPGEKKTQFLDQPPSGALGRDAIAIEKVTAFKFLFLGWNGCMLVLCELFKIGGWSGVLSYQL